MQGMMSQCRCFKLSLMDQSKLLRAKCHIKYGFRMEIRPRYTIPIKINYSDVYDGREVGFYI